MKARVLRPTDRLQYPKTHCGIWGHHKFVPINTPEIKIKIKKIWVPKCHRINLFYRQAGCVPVSMLLLTGILFVSLHFMRNVILLQNLWREKDILECSWSQREDI
ncbi:hypothetical protein L798_00796 [Zootermopsis nevadensis]|uniref:Uncharacterized protein n=1 Tax=Zootermopsis nevadensis TaxID=136037 RepID=A0A067QI14_ZOONE|nr:hypothetical protein L798_00796 [Zootermopsis nevadensis]